MDVQRMYVTRPGFFVSAAMLLPLLDVIAVVLRFRARTKQREALKLDDWLMIPATVCCPFRVLLLHYLIRVQILVMAIGITTTYGVSKEAIAHPTEIPPDFTGSPLELVTPQITLVYKVRKESS